MAEHTTKVREVAWNELFPWMILLRSVRIALMARVFILGALGLLTTMFGWWVLANMFSGSTDPVVMEWRRNVDLGIWEDSMHRGVPNPWVNTAAQSAGEVFESAANSMLIRAPINIWLYITRPFFQMFQGDLTATGFLFLLLCGVWELLAWGLFGGAITRIAALKFTRDEAPGIVAALRHSASNILSYSLPPLGALAGTAVFALQLVALGAIMRADIGAFAVAIAWPFVLLLGLMMSVLLLGALFGWPLMWATVSVEGTDAFDALSRSYAYTYNRPLRLLWYVLFAGFLAVISMFVVKLFASSAVALGHWGIAWGADDLTQDVVVDPLPVPAIVIPPPPAPPAIGTASTAPETNDAAPVQPPPPEPAEPSELLRTSARIVHFWKQLVAVLVAGFQSGFLWVSAVGIYLLLRRDIDGVQISEVYLDPDDDFGTSSLIDEPGIGVPDLARPT
jgi:hypothetical protein